jgi:dimethylargininase
MRGMFTKAIVRPPAPNFADGLTSAGLGAPDYHQALAQHAAYCVALEQCGLELIRLAADRRYPDSCFVEDAAIVFGALPDGRATAPDAALIVGLRTKAADEGVRVPSRDAAIITRPGALSRRGEVDSMRDELARLFPSIHEIQSPATLDGGDVCEAGKHFFIGISARTNEAGAQQLAEVLASHGFTHSLVDTAGISGLLHLKSGVAYLRDNTLIVTAALAPRDEFRGYELIHVDPGDEYAANCITVNGRVLIAAGYPRFEAKLRAFGCETIALEMSEFRKMDGGLSCLSLRW